jgi:hypothetical protein
MVNVYRDLRILQIPLTKKLQVLKSMSVKRCMLFECLSTCVHGKLQYPELEGVRHAKRQIFFVVKPSCFYGRACGI